MNTQMHVKAKPSSVPLVSFEPASTGLLLRTGTSSRPAGASAEQDDENELGLALQPETLAHDFGRISLRDGASKSLQLKPAISQPGDPYEQEADRVAKQIINLPEPRWQREGVPKGKEEDEDELLQIRPLVQRPEELASQGQKGEFAQAEPSSPRQVNSMRETPSSVQGVLRSPGRPLDPLTRSSMERRFGHDFGNVRVHLDDQAAKSAKAVNALAYTVDSHIAFGAGRYSAATDAGKQLIAHELAHVVQQGAARPLATTELPGKSTRTEQRGGGPPGEIPLLRTEKGIQCFTDVSSLAAAGLGSIEDVADALLEQVSVDQDPLLAELVQARTEFAKAGALQLPASAALELADIARSVAGELPSWIPTPQIPDPLPDPGNLVMASVDPRIAFMIVIVIIVILIILYLLWRFVVQPLWESVKRLYEQATQPSEETDTGQTPETGETGEVPGTGDTGVADYCTLPGEAPKANDCGKGSCAASESFCTPCQSEEGARQWRESFGPMALQTIGGFVDPRVVPVWETYLNGGASKEQNYSEHFGLDFAESDTTLRAADYLVDALEDNLKADPPRSDALSAEDVRARIGALYGENGDLENPASGQSMNFNDIKSIPGNLAGGAGTDQTTCNAGANPSTQKDERRARMEVSITRIDADFVEVLPVITFTVRDTVDLCPGDCGTGIERGATVPFSRFEATGISGDVPFKVTYQVFPDPFELELSEAGGEPGEQGVFEEDTAAAP
jgi:hypothetical protein